jgi:hypothetical protein
VGGSGTVSIAAPFFFEGGALFEAPVSVGPRERGFAGPQDHGLAPALLPRAVASADGVHDGNSPGGVSVAPTTGAPERRHRHGGIERMAPQALRLEQLKAGSG